MVKFPQLELLKISKTDYPINNKTPMFGTGSSKDFQIASKHKVLNLISSQGNKN